MIVVSRSWRKVSARACLRVEKDCLASSEARERLLGLALMVDALRGEVVVGEVEVESRMARAFLGDWSGFWGEWWSFHSLMWELFQKASMFCRCGGVGMRNLFLEGDTSRDLEVD